ncbi:hypothetical protein DSO57_1037636 [Entomophthora muscae]|uniref:Uncharacterized protein n=1 Tax=Entomophthora muscae TaxID=34485 RepID=A0ACC2SNC1_9FUNG|nr:hypothetical protein DSO57_1037636 [Entomophthora muscae]
MVSIPVGSLVTGLNPSAGIDLLGGMFPSRWVSDILLASLKEPQTIFAALLATSQSSPPSAGSSCIHSGPGVYSNVIQEALIIPCAKEAPSAQDFRKLGFVYIAVLELANQVGNLQN